MFPSAWMIITSGCTGQTGIVRVHRQLAEHAAERDMTLHREILVAEKNDLMRGQRVMDPLEHRRLDGLIEVDASKSRRRSAGVSGCTEREPALTTEDGNEEIAPIDDHQRFTIGVAIPAPNLCDRARQRDPILSKNDRRDRFVRRVCAGSQPAMTPIANSTAAATASVTGSRGWSSNNWAWMNPTAQRLSAVPGGDAGADQPDDAPQHEPPNVARAGAKREANAEFRAPPADQIARDAVQAEGRQEKRQHAEKHAEQCHQTLLHDAGVVLVAEAAERVRDRGLLTHQRIGDRLPRRRSRRRGLHRDRKRRERLLLRPRHVHRRRNTQPLRAIDGIRDDADDRVRLVRSCSAAEPQTDHVLAPEKPPDERFIDDGDALAAVQVLRG